METLLYDVDEDGIAVITINQEDKLNALSTTVLSDLNKAFRQARGDAAVKGVVLTGAGVKSFVAGADIQQFPDLDAVEGHRFALRGQAVFNRIEEMPKPVVAAVNGFALGGGCELAMACHLRIASENASFGQPEVNLGIIPGYGGTQRLPRLVGRGIATELVLTGARISAQRAY
jgi:enoyl-CoA hydratase